MFICAHCPYVKHIEKGSGCARQRLRRQPIGIVAISSNDAITHPADSPAGLKLQAETCGFVFPYLYDERRPWLMPTRPPARRTFFSSMKVSASSIAASSIQSRPGNGVPVTGQDLRAAIDQVLAGKPPHRSAPIHRLQHQVEGIR
jgi:hypothetical protein